MMRPGMLGGDSDDETAPKPRRRTLNNFAGAGFALVLAAACGAAGRHFLGAQFDHGAMRQPLEISMQRSVEIRASGVDSSAQLAAHHANMLNRLREGVAMLSEIARGKDDHAEWARRALASIREGAQDPQR